MRQHIEQLLAAIAVLAFALFISYFHTGSVIPTKTAQHTDGTLTPLPAEPTSFATTTLPSFTFSTSTINTLLAPHTTSSNTKVAVSTSTPSRKPATTPKPAPQPTPKQPATPTPPLQPAATSTPSTSTPTQDTGELAILKKSIVNILCVAHDGSLRSTSGSGVIIDPSGIVLTAAHVAQESLLEEDLGSSKVFCAIRTGSPAKSTYFAHPIYVSEAWVHANATTLISSQPTGTGEHDYALLAITETVSGTPVSGGFSAVPLATGQPHVGDQVYIGSYGAQDLTSTQVRSGLYPTLVTSTIKDRYTFTTNTVDVLAIAGSAASQEGSSGGAVVNTDGELIGLITTSMTTGPVSEREMRAITPAYMRRSFTEETGKNYDSYFSTASVLSLVGEYASQAETLGAYIAKAIGLP